MTTSAAILREASRLVHSYLRVGPHYVNMCRKPLDAADWYVDADSVMEICKSNAEKLLDRATSADQEARALMDHIERSVDGNFVKWFYRSPNWAHAYSLLKEFSQNTLRIEADLARTRLDYLNSYQPSPRELDFSRIDALEGNYHDDVEYAFEILQEKMVVNSDSLNVKEINYEILLLIYGSCFAVSKWFEIDLHSSSWNSFKRSLEGYFTERAGMKPGESRATGLPSGGMKLSHHVPKCWQDMEALEQSIVKISSYVRTAEFYCALEGTRAIQLTKTPNHLESFRWLLNLAGTRIVPKVIHAFGDEI